MCHRSGSRNRKKIKKGLDFANRNNIPYVIIVGEDEIKSDSYIKLQDDFDLNMVNEIIPILNHKDVAPMFF